MIMNILKKLLLISFVVVVLTSSVSSEYVDADTNYSEDAETYDEVSILGCVFKVLGYVVISIIFSIWFVMCVEKKKD